MEIIKVKGNTFCINTGMTYIPFYKINDEEIILMDSGWAKGERKGLEALLESNNFKVAAIICSHSHIDHIGNNAYFKGKYNCIIAMAQYEALVCRSTVNLKVYNSLMALTEVEEHMEHMVCETDIMISDDWNKINVCGVKFKIVHTPGHSPAHMCIITPDDVAYLGDALISYENMEEVKMPYVFILREDLKSKEKLYDLKCSKYIVAHKGIYSDITKLIYDNIAFYKQWAQNVYKLIDCPMTMEEILRASIRSFDISIRSRYKYIAIEEDVISYVEYLQDTGMLRLIVDDGVVKYAEVDYER